MPTNYEVVQATQDHAEELAPRVRQSDLDELSLTGCPGPLETLLAAMRSSPKPRAGLADSRVVCMFGVAQKSLLLNEGQGVPWLLGSEELPQHARQFLRLSKAYIKELRQDYDYLANWVDPRNKEALRWLLWLGFEIADEPVEIHTGAMVLPARMVIK